MPIQNVKVIDITANEAKIRSGKLYGSGGEVDNHKKLKEYIYNHPESIGVKDFKRRHMEYILLSGDRLDVYFELNNGAQIAVEIKSISSSDALKSPAGLKVASTPPRISIPHLISPIPFIMAEELSPTLV